MTSTPESSTVTTDTGTAAPAEPTLLRTAIRFALSILFGMAAGIVLQVWTMAFLGWLGREALYVRSIYTPVGFITTAIVEGLVVAAQVSAGIATRTGRREDALRHLPTFVAVGGGFLAVTTLVFVAFADPFLAVLEVTQEQRRPVVEFVVAVTAASILGLVPYLCGAALRGVGRPGLSTALGVPFAVLSIVGMLLCNEFTDLGALSVPVGGLLGTVVIGVASVLVLRRCDLRAPGWRLDRAALRAAWTLAAPVAATFLLLSVVTFGYLRVLRDAGDVDIAGFSLGQMATSFLMVGAFAAGSGAAIAVNLRPGEQRRELNERGLVVTARIAMLVYLAVGAVSFLLRDPIARLLTSDREIAAVAADYLQWLAPTFALFGATLAILTYLEQIGRAGAAALLNTVYFAIVLGVAFLLSQPVDSDALARLLAISNVVGFASLWYSVRYLVRRT
ncbi:MATE family efflux transporter [Dactylosporangium sp. NPDC005572]|uniref:MATE family efflux transporter n=1 Tax=Dactylosporangium sp. NPDC005572 TaxID=3156889 RepID=UPI0033A5E481